MTAEPKEAGKVAGRVVKPGVALREVLREAYSGVTHLKSNHYHAS